MNCYTLSVWEYSKSLLEIFPLLFWCCVCEYECICVNVGTFLSLYIQFFLDVTSLHLFNRVLESYCKRYKEMLYL